MYLATAQFAQQINWPIFLDENQHFLLISGTRDLALLIFV